MFDHYHLWGQLGRFQANFIPLVFQSYLLRFGGFRYVTFWGPKNTSKNKVFGSLGVPHVLDMFSLGVQRKCNK